jgi:hypothetical protein
MNHGRRRHESWYAPCKIPLKQLMTSSALQATSWKGYLLLPAKASSPTACSWRKASGNPHLSEVEITGGTEVLRFILSVESCVTCVVCAELITPVDPEPQRPTPPRASAKMGHRLGIGVSWEGSIPLMELYAKGGTSGPHTIDQSQEPEQ